MKTSPSVKSEPRFELFKEPFPDEETATAENTNTGQKNRNPDPTTFALVSLELVDWALYKGEH